MIRNMEMSRVKIEQKYVALIIALDGKLRNSRLIYQLEESNIFLSIEVVKGLWPSDLDPGFLYEQKRNASQIYGREITEIEIAIKESHELAYRRALHLGLERVLIFEDDALISSQDSFVNSMREITRVESPTIWTLYSPDWSVWIRRKTHTQSAFPPPGAVAYLINRMAMISATQEDSLGIADWPTWSRRVDFFLVPNSGVSHAPEGSYAEKQRSETKYAVTNAHSILKTIVNVRSVNQFYWCVYTPLVWKISGYICSVLFRRQMNTTDRIIFGFRKIR